MPYVFLLHSNPETVLARSYRNFLFHSLVNLELYAGALSFWNIIDFSSKCFANNCWPQKFASILPSVGTRFPMLSYVLQPKTVAYLRMAFSFTQEFRQPNFIVQFEADFQKFYQYSIALKYVMHNLLTPGYFPTPTLSLK